MDRVDLAKASKAFLDPAYALQPFQGRFPDVVSTDDKNDFRFIAGILSGILAVGRERNNQRAYDPEEQDRQRISHERPP
jgi:hypothetical protein